MTRSATRIQDKDSFRRLSVVQSTQDPTKYGIVILNPDGTTLTGSAGDAKVFTLSSTSDITNAQKAYNYLGRGKFPIIKYDGKFYLYSYSTTGNVYFTVWNEKVVDQASYSTYCKDGIQLAVSSNTVTAITSLLISTNDSGFLRVGKNYGTAYTPSNDGSPASKKYVDDTAATKVSDTAYASSWDGVTGVAPSKNAVYDKINSIDELIPSAATSSNQLADKDYVNDGINSVTAYYITKNANGEQWATYAELAAATTFYSGGVVRIPTKNDYTIVLADENHDNATTRYIYNSGWEYQYTVNETALTQAQLDALNSGITAAKVSAYDGYASTISGKQDALSTQTAYTTKGTSTKVATISTNTLGQVTAITETSIDFPVTSVNGSTGAVTGLQAELVSGTNIKTINGTSVLGSGDVTVSEFSPSNAGNTGNILTKTANGYEWDTAPESGIGISTQANNILTSGAKLRAGTEAHYQALATKDSNTVYLTI